MVKAKLQSELLSDIDTHANDPLLSLRAVGEALGKHPSTIRAWIRDGVIKTVVQPNKLHKIRKSDLERILSGSPMGDDPEIVTRVDNLLE